MSPTRKKRIVTIGSFDGAHKGHQGLIDRTVAEAKARKMKSVVLTFDRPPKFFFQKNGTFSLLSTEFEKKVLLKKMGIDEILPLPSKKKFFSTRPFAFFRDVLINQVGAKGIVVGLDFRFGQNRSAGAVDLVRWGLAFGIPVWVIPPIKQKGLVVSSSAIRDALRKGLYKKAAALLGHSYYVTGRVKKGKGVGKTLGFPTANLTIQKEKIVPPGVYAIRGWVNPAHEKAILKGRKFLKGVVNVGVRPTFKDGSHSTIEAHFFNANLSLNGKTLFLEFVSKIRSEKKFRTLKALQRAIAQDVQKAKRILKKNRSI